MKSTLLKIFRTTLTIAIVAGFPIEGNAFSIFDSQGRVIMDDNLVQQVRGEGRPGGRPGGRVGGPTVNRGNTVNVNRRNTVNVNRRTNVNVNRANVHVVARPVRVWVPKPHYGTIVAGVALGTIIAVSVARSAPPAPAPGMCWYWTTSAQTQGYWDYC